MQQPWSEYSALLAAGEDDVGAILSSGQRFFGDVFNRMGKAAGLKRRGSHACLSVVGLLMPFLYERYVRYGTICWTET